MKKVYITRAVKMIALLLSIVLLTLLIQEYLFLYHDYNAERFRKFYKEESDSLDVVFMGASEVHASYSPGYAYDKFGYTSYMYTQDSNHGQLFKSQLKEILAHQSPELIIVETYGFLYPGEVDEARLRLFVENIPVSLNRIKTIADNAHEHKLSYLLPMIKYHGKWWSHEMMMANIENRTTNWNEPTFFKGMVTNTTIFDSPEPEQAPMPTEKPVTIDINESLMEFLEFCRQEGVENIVFVNLPRHDRTSDLNDILIRAGEVERVVTDYGYPFLELQSRADEIGIDFSKDYYDDHHMNTYGQFKMTEYFGNLIMNTYGVTPREQTAANQAHWQECGEYANKYYAFADECLRQGKQVTLDTEVSFHKELKKWEATQ